MLDKIIELGFSFYYLRKTTKNVIVFDKKKSSLIQNVIPFAELSKSNDGVEHTRVTGEVSAAIIEDILHKLLLFEKRMGFLQSDLKLTNLAYEFATNANYLSKVVNHFKGKNFSQYVNALRISYVVEKLKKDKKFRKYTIKAISKEAGFNTTESFGKAFYQIMGILPSSFIKRLEEE